MPDWWTRTPLAYRVAFCICATMILYFLFQPWVTFAATDTGFHP